jgi:BR-signaling kinase
MWTKQMQDMLNARKKGDLAFREKDFAVAIERYSEVCHVKVIDELKDF